jgi:hypothetical protein
VQDIATDPQLQARAFWQDVTAPDGRTQRHCGAFYIRDGLRPALKVPTPPQVAPASPETEREPASA